MYPDFIYDIGGKWEHKKSRQLEWIAKNCDNYRKKLGIEFEAPVILVRGNHDWFNLNQVFLGNCVESDPGDQIFIKNLEVNGKFYKTASVRGVGPINSFWSDEINDTLFAKNLEQIPFDIDLLLSHQPPRNILDFTKYSVSVGSMALSEWLYARSLSIQKPLWHFFGHIHEDHGIYVKSYDGFDYTFSNAATTFNEIEI